MVMSNSSRSITVFGIYLFLSGISFVFLPNVILPLFGFPVTTEVWIRLAGLLVLILGIYFLYSVRHNDRIFFRVTIYGRLIFCAGVIMFATAGWGSPTLVIFGLVDLAGAAWTWLSLRAESV